jgi:hypothetical protein
MKYKNYNFLPRNLTLEFKSRKVEFLEPTIWQVMQFQELIKDENYMEAFSAI